MSEGDRREFARVAFRVEATIASDHETVVCADVRDISLKGLYASGSGRLPSGARCMVNMVLGGTESETRLRIRGRVARSEVGGMAVEFLEMGLDTFYHLRNLVLYNAADHARVEEEFRSHRRERPQP
jgi:hypothetical protein